MFKIDLPSATKACPEQQQEHTQPSHTPEIFSKKLGEAVTSVEETELIRNDSFQPTFVNNITAPPSVLGTFSASAETILVTIRDENEEQLQCQEAYGYCFNACHRGGDDTEATTLTETSQLPSIILKMDMSKNEKVPINFL